MQYGSWIKALVVYLKAYQLIPFRRIAELVTALVGGSISEGTVASMVKSVSASLEPSLSSIISMLTSAPVAHFDETGCSVEGQGTWVHVASTKTLTYYTIHSKRGMEAMNDAGILPSFVGTAVHDHWKPYFTYGGCRHALCNAHHLRELTYVEEQDHQKWAGDMKTFLLATKKAVDARKATGYTSLGEDDVRRFLRRYRNIVRAGYADNPEPVPISGKRGRPKDTKAGNLVRRLKRYRREVLAFMYDFSVPFSNNLAERDLRMMKIQQKVSGSFRSNHGGPSFCRISELSLDGPQARFITLRRAGRSSRRAPFHSKSGLLTRQVWFF